MADDKIKNNNIEVISAYTTIPYNLLNEETGNNSEVLQELAEIKNYYKIYKKGKSFTTEGTNGDYVPADLRYKMSASLVNKEARFLFGETPEITITSKSDIGKETEEIKDVLTTYNDLVKTILYENHFEEILLKASKDCFIGKRVAGLINFNPQDGVNISFIPATNFLYETKIDNPNVLIKFVCFVVVKETAKNKDKRIFKKKYTLENDAVFLEEILFDGCGEIIEVVTKKQKTLLKDIPVAIFINDGLSGEKNGESEIEILQDYEKYYSKLSNADKDAERKSMNPIRYTVDMESNSTKNLSSSAGSQWDLGSDQNLENPHPMIGMLEPSMSYSVVLKTTLDRIKTVGYEQIDMPNVTLETLQGSITSGKALKAIYWPLIVRCKEKMKMWGPQLRKLIKIILDGSMLYGECIKKYTTTSLIAIEYEILIEQKFPLLEDEFEEKNMDLAEVEQQVMSRKTYMKKWRGLTDDEVQEELEQIALERQILEDSFAGTENETEDNLEETEETEETEEEEEDFL